MSKDYSLGQVIMKDAYCVNAFRKDVAYLLSLDADRLLAGFYENAGLKPKKMRYSGWENMLIGGHTLGHYLTAAAQGYANAQATKAERDGLFAKIKTLIDGLLECQASSKGKPGFVFGATIQDLNNVELQFDYVEKGKTNIITQAWVPWYTMHKILDGVVSAYELTGYEPALTLASGIGDWTYNRASSWSEETHKTVLSIEYGGMNDTLYELYKCTKKPEHLKAAHMFDEEELFKKVASGAANVLNNRHANTTIPKFVGALNRYLTVGDEKYLEYVKAFWDMVVERHTYATGGNSEWEHFGEDRILDAERTNCNNETCNTYNMLKMTRKLFMITGDKKYADYYENTPINAILSSQNPETGMTMYFQPMATGYFKVYGDPFDKFWCCTGSGMENFTKLGSSVYFKDDKGIIVNLYLSSELTDGESGLKLVQKADFPKKDTAVFTVRTKKSVKRKLSFRIPDWAFGYEISVEGEGLDKEDTAKETKDTFKKNGYVSIERKWNDGDKVYVKFDMKVVAKSLPDCGNVFAFKYGPVLLSANLGFENEISGKTGVDVTIPTNKIVESEYLNVKKGTVSEFIADIDSHFKKDLKKLLFTLNGTDRKLTFGPHYLKTNERYGIYWYFLDKNASDDSVERRKFEEKRRENILDTVQPGYGQYENDELHAMEDGGSVGAIANGTTRYATSGGRFTYHMKAEEGKDLILEMHLLREDNGKPLIVTIGDEEIFNKKLHYTGKNAEYVEEIVLPKELVKEHLETRKTKDGKFTTVSFTFRGGMFVESARLFGFLYLLRKYK
ncbi:MAG: glycoside hydrolase family 127 protein [Lachnospiraceae bacterium]|nr:glycoside hydrolase family 127 protein [Lachnospiraceae bacterium]